MSSVRLPVKGAALRKSCQLVAPKLALDASRCRAPCPLHKAQLNQRRSTLAAAAAASARPAVFMFGFGGDEVCLVGWGTCRSEFLETPQSGKRSLYAWQSNMIQRKQKACMESCKVCHRSQCLPPVRVVKRSRVPGQKVDEGLCCVTAKKSITLDVNCSPGPSNMSENPSRSSVPGTGCTNTGCPCSDGKMQGCGPFRMMSGHEVAVHN
eukprot:1140344-Pelagomonas_calceolata.AAC.9